MAQIGEIVPTREVRDVDDAAICEIGDNYIFSLEDIFVDDHDRGEDPVEVADVIAAGGVEDDAADEYKDPDDVGEGPSGDEPIVYDGGDSIPGIPTREELVQNNCPEIHARINAHIREKKAVFFMPHDIEETPEYVRGVPVYRLHMFGPLMDGTKAHVILEDIDVFFDVRIPERPKVVAKLSKQARARLDEIDPMERRKLEFTEHLYQLFAEHGVQTKKVEDISAFPSFGYHVDKCAYKRVYTTDLKQRKAAILAVRGFGYETASDDRSAYYRKVSREFGLPLTEWAILSNYRYAAGRDEADPVSSHVFRVSVKDVKPLIDPMADRAEREKKTKIKQSNPHLLKDRTLVMGWDIETHTTRKTGDLPRAHNKEDRAFCLCATFHWKDSTEALLKICFVDKPSNPDSRWITVVCGTERNIFRAFAIAWRALAPDSVIGFNDSDYDWPFVVERAHQYEDLAWMYEKMSAIPRRRQTSESVYKWNFRRDTRIKITPEETFFSSYFKVPGCVPIDVRVCFKKLYPKSEVAKGSSLNFYLKECNLSGKADMPVIRMWRGYEGGDPEMMRKINHYCIIDSWRCQQLMVKRNVINDYREVSTLSFVNFADSHYYAGGMKVCNMLIAYAIRKGIVCSNIAQEAAEKGKYPGAWVFPPEKGLENKRPVTGVDAASLYPSIIMTYNLSPEKIILDEGEAARLRTEGKTLHPITFMFNGRQVTGWSIRHNNVPGDIGLYPAILIDLFAKRKDMKKSMEPLHRLKVDVLEIIMGVAKKENVPLAEAARRTIMQATADLQEAKGALERFQGSEKRTEVKQPGNSKSFEMIEASKRQKIAKGFQDRISKANDLIAAIAALQSEAGGDDAALIKLILTKYEQVCFDYENINSKQKALKVFMNTFYGEAGNSRSPFFLLQLAGGVTSAGQDTIKKAWEFARQKGFRLKYGDTDSLYVVCPESCYEKCDADFAAGRLSKEEYWAEMVRVTMAVIETFLEELNAFLAEDNGTKYLTFAYEDVLFPVAFTGKKKYFAIAHITTPNFRPKKLFIRGIDVVKQGQTELSRSIGYKCMWDAVNIENTLTLHEIVEQTLTDAVRNGEQWKFEHFIQSDAYKPDKDNKPVQKFIARMKVKHAIEVEENKRRVAAGNPPKPYLYEIPEPGERFKYVIVRRGADFDLMGYKASAKKGDVMEFAHVAAAIGLQVDVAYYMISYVAGLCARFINYAGQFQPMGAEPPRNPSLPAIPVLDDKAIDKYSQAKAKKYLENIIRGVNNADKKTTAARGYAYKRAYKAAAGLAQADLVKKVGVGADVLHGSHLSYELFIDDDDTEPTEDDAKEAGIPGPVSTSVTRCLNKLVEIAKEVSAEVCEVDCTVHKRYTLLAQKIGIAPDGSDLVDGKKSAATTNIFAAILALNPPARGRQRRMLTSQLIYQSSILRAEGIARDMLARVIQRVSDVAVKYEVDLERLVHQFRVEEHANNPLLGACVNAAQSPADDIGAVVSLTLDAADKEALAALRKGWFALIGVYLVRAHEDGFLRYLEQLRDKKLKIVRAPANVGTKKALSAATTYAAREVAVAGQYMPPVGIPRLS